MSKEAMKLALENICSAKLCEINSMSSRHEMIRLMDEAITALREALAEQPAQQHIEHCLWARNGNTPCPHVQTAQQEPVAIVDANDEGYWAEILPDRSVKVGQPLYTSPPAQRKPLTGEEMNQIEARWEASMHGSKIAFVVRETEAAHGIKENT